MRFLLMALVLVRKLKLLPNIKYKLHQISTFICFSSPLAVVSALSIEARRLVENEEQHQQVTAQAAPGRAALGVVCVVDDDGFSSTATQGDLQ